MLKKFFLLFLLIAGSGGLTMAQTKYLDSSFHYNGLQDSIVAIPDQQFADELSSLVLQPDGKMLMIRRFHNDATLLRVNANGTKDVSFGTNGTLIVPSSFPGNTQAKEIVLQPDGKILIVGDGYFSAQQSDIILYRLLSNGTPDLTFGNNGIVITSSPGNNTNDFASGILLRSNGKILVGGQAGNGRPLLIQYNTNGSLDASFGSGGITVYTLAGRTVDMRDMLLQPDGKIVVLGSSFVGNSGFCFIARFNPAGTPDLTFDVDGFREESIHDYTNSWVSAGGLQSDGKIVLGIFVSNGVDSLYAKRLLPNGSLDLTFGENGLYKSWGGTQAYNTALRSMIVMPGDSLLLGCVAIPGQNRYDFTVLRLTPNGKPDSAWGNKGRIVADFRNSYDELFDIALQPDGKIVACGSSRLVPNSSYVYPTIARFKALSGPSSNGILVPDDFAGTLKLYPNPAGNTVRIEGALTGDQVTIWNTMGQAVLVQQINSPVLELGALPAGLYQVLVQRKGAVAGSGKLVKE